MILFLDTVAPLPEFSIIEDNKIIYCEKIIKKEGNKMSDSIIPSYNYLDSKFSLDQNIKFLITNTGPGSYTALRVGISFLSGLSISKKINLIGVSCFDLFNYIILEDDNLQTSAFFITSSNNQRFIYLFNSKANKYEVYKIEKDNMLESENIPFINNIYTNDELGLLGIDSLKNINIKKIFFNKIVKLNIKKILSIPIQDIVNPIYIANNKLLS